MRCRPLGSTEGSPTVVQNLCRWFEPEAAEGFTPAMARRRLAVLGVGVTRGGPTTIPELNGSYIVRMKENNDEGACLITLGTVASYSEATKKRCFYKIWYYGVAAAAHILREGK